MTLEHWKPPGAYSVWVDTKAHPGESAHAALRHGLRCRHPVDVEQFSTTVAARERRRAANSVAPLPRLVGPASRRSLRQTISSGHERGDEAIRRRHGLSTSSPRADGASTPSPTRCRYSMRHVAAEARRPGQPAARALPTTSCRAAEGRAGIDLPLRDRLDRRRCPLGRRALPRSARERGAAAVRPRAHFISAEIPYDDYLALDDLALPDVMLAYENGRPIAPAGARRARQDRDPGHGTATRTSSGSSGSRSYRARGAGYWEQRGYDVNAWVGHPTDMADATTRPGAVRGREPPALRPALHAHRAAPALGPRERVPRAARIRADLYIPALSTTFADRPLIKDVHFYTAVSWAGAMILIALLGNRRAVARTIARSTSSTATTALPRGRTHAPRAASTPARRVNVIVTAAFATLFFISGMILWLGERNTDIRLGGRSTSTTR